MAFRTGKGALLATGSLLPLMACSSTVVVTNPMIETTAQAMAKDLEHRRVDLTLIPDDSQPDVPVRLTGYVFHPNNVSFSFGEHAGYSPSPRTLVHFEDVQTISFIDSRQGAWKGLFIGSLTGLIVGTLSGGVIGGVACMVEDENVGRCEKAYMLPITLGVTAVSGLVGALIGYARGHRTTYKFIPAP